MPDALTPGPGPQDEPAPAEATAVPNEPPNQTQNEPLSEPQDGPQDGPSVTPPDAPDVPDRAVAAGDTGEASDTGDTGDTEETSDTSYTSEPATAPKVELSPAQCAARLAEMFPALFGPEGPPKPIKLRIQADLQQRAPGLFTRKALSVVLHRHTTTTPYLKALVAAATRFDLEGQPAGEIAEEHRQAAREEVERRRALVAARRAAEAQARGPRASRPARPQFPSGNPGGDAAPAAGLPETLQGEGEGRSERAPRPPRPAREARAPRAPRDGPQAQDRNATHAANSPSWPQGPQGPHEPHRAPEASRPHGLNHPPRSGGPRGAQGSAPSSGRGPSGFGRPDGRPERHTGDRPGQDRPGRPPQPHRDARPPRHDLAAEAPRQRPASDGAPAALPDDPARRERALLLRTWEASSLTKANFCVLKRITEAELDAQLALAHQERGPSRPRP